MISSGAQVVAGSDNQEFFAIKIDNKHTGQGPGEILDGSANDVQDIGGHQGADRAFHIIPLSLRLKFQHIQLGGNALLRFFVCNHQIRLDHRALPAHPMMLSIFLSVRPHYPLPFTSFHDGTPLRRKEKPEGFPRPKRLSRLQRHRCRFLRVYSLLIFSFSFWCWVLC
jgi:hypothetical protein